MINSDKLWNKKVGWPQIIPVFDFLGLHAALIVYCQDCFSPNHTFKIPFVKIKLKLSSAKKRNNVWKCEWKIIISVCYP